MCRRAFLCALAAAVFAVAAAPAGAATGSIGLRLLDAPVATHLDPRARIYIVDHVAPGTVIRRRIEVRNTTASAAHVVLYPAAAQIRGGTFLGDAGRTRNEISTWSSVTPRSSDIPSGGRLTAVVTIAVPSDAAPGERYGVIWAQVRAAAPAGGGVTQVNRVGIREYVSVGPGGPPAADFTISALSARRSADGRPMIVARVHNTGGRALDVSGTVRLRAGPGGLSAGPFPADLGLTLGIGDTEPVTVMLDRRLPTGPWHATITLHSGLVSRTAHATVSFPVAKHSSTSALLIAGVIGVLVLLLGAALLVARTLRRPASPLAGSS